MFFNNTATGGTGFPSGGSFGGNSEGSIWERLGGSLIDRSENFLDLWMADRFNEPINQPAPAPEPEPDRGNAMIRYGLIGIAGFAVYKLFFKTKKPYTNVKRK